MADGAPGMKKAGLEARLSIARNRCYLSRLRFFFSSSVNAPLVDAELVAELVPVASVDCVAVPVADWLPVVVVAVWPEVWSPVVVLAVVLTD